MNEERIKKLIRELIIEIGEDPTREGLAKTPERVARAYKEILVGMTLIPIYLFNFLKIQKL